MGSHVEHDDDTLCLKTPYLDVAPYIVVALDTEGKISLINRKGAEILECGQAEAVGSDWFEVFIPPDRRRQAHAEFESMLAGRSQGFCEKSIPLLTGKGQERIIRWHSAALRDRDGTLRGVLCSGEDITAQEQANAQVRHLNSVLRGIRNVNQFIALDVPPEVLISQACKMLTGTVGYPECWILVDSEEDRHAAASSSASQNRAQHMIRYLNADGSFPACVQRAFAGDITITADRRHTCPACPLSRRGKDLICMTTPLACQGRSYGAMCVAVPAALAEDPEEVALFRELGRDIALALDRHWERKLRRRVQKDLIASEQRFERAIEDAPFPIMIQAENGTVMTVNRTWTELTGYTLSDIPTVRDWVRRAHIENTEEVLEHIAELYGRSTPCTGHQRTVKCKDGSRRVWLFSSLPLGSLPDGRRILVTMASDVSERRLAEEQARDLARFPAENPNPVMRVGADGELLFANAACAPLLSTWGISTGERVPPEVLASVTETMQSDAPGTMEISTGDETYLLSVAPIAEDGFANLYAMDITQHRRLEVHLRQQQKLESIGTLAGGVAHEINNPINGIMNYAQLMKDELGDEKPKLTEFADEIIHETERVATIVRNLLQFSRFAKETHSPARVEDIIQGTLSLIRTVFRRDQITLNLEIPEDLPRIKCRSQQIQQVLMNLMSNARDALNARYQGYHEDKVLTVLVSCLEHDDHRWVRIMVEDHGTGIPPDILERIYDPFFTTKPRDIGTGLGLSISHSIVKDHRGELKVESEVGKYTRFCLDLPVDNGWELQPKRHGTEA